MSAVINNPQFAAAVIAQFLPGAASNPPMQQPQHALVCFFLF